MRYLRGILDARALALPAGDTSPAHDPPVDGELAAAPVDAARAAAEGEPL